MTKYTKYNKRDDYTKTVQREAYEMVAAHKDGTPWTLATETIEAAMCYAEEGVFFAEMSDDYTVTRAECAEIYEWAHPAYVELAARQ